MATRPEGRREGRTAARAWRPFAVLAAAAALAILCLAPWTARAQLLPPTGGSEPPVLSDLSAAELQDLLGRLTDEQVRGLLLEKLQAEVAASASSESLNLMTRIETLGVEVAQLFSDLWERSRPLSEAWRLLERRLEPSGGLETALLILAAAYAAGFAARAVWGLRSRRRQNALAERHLDRGAYASLRTVWDAFVYLFYDLVGVGFFFIAAATAAHLLSSGDPDQRAFLVPYVRAATSVLVVYAFVRVAFPRGWAVYRILPFDDKLTREATLWLLALSIIWNFGFESIEPLFAYGFDRSFLALAILAVATVFTAVVLFGVFARRRSVAVAFGGGPRPEGAPPSFQRAAANGWHVVAAGYSVVLWAVSVVSILRQGLNRETGGLALTSVVILVAAPALDFILGRLLVGYFGDSPLAQSIRRALRILIVAGVAVIFLSLWGVTRDSVRGLGVEGWLLDVVADVGLTALIGYSAWRVVRAFVDARLAEESPHDDGPDEHADGEGGAGLSRTATLLPLLRSAAFVIIFVVCFFSAAGSLGLNVAALVAGAGVVGIAIGFGAQTLVRDIVSGIFFLVDDAFRSGEYVDVGSVKGTVEKISLRSFRLRHHLGALHTIPFGEIQTLTNYSRDWVIMKLPLRLTFDTDPQKVKKIVKRIGAEMMEDELLAPKLLAPPKSQGVIQMEDTAQILRVKFTAVPGQQFVLRRELLHRIRKAFEEEGVHLAPREVAVRTIAADAGGQADAAAAAAQALQDQQARGAPALPDR